VLVYASLPAGHSVITGTAVPGATLKITKDFNLYTAPVQIGDTVYALGPKQSDGSVVASKVYYVAPPAPTPAPTPAPVPDVTLNGSAEYI